MRALCFSILLMISTNAIPCTVEDVTDAAIKGVVVGVVAGVVVTAASGNPAAGVVAGGAFGAIVAIKDLEEVCTVQSAMDAIANFK